MRNYPGGAKRVDEYPEEDLTNRIDDLKEKIKIKNERIAALESALKNQQDEELKHRQNDRNELYAWMGETVRMRRLMETIGEDRDEYKKRAEKAERGIRNLKKWLDISGEKVEPDV